MDGVERYGAKWEGRATKSVCHDLNYALLHLTVAASMAHMIEKWSEKEKGTKKWRKIRVIAEAKMSLSLVAVLLYTSIRERIKCVGQLIVRCSRRDNKNRARGFVIKL